MESPTSPVSRSEQYPVAHLAPGAVASLVLGVAAAALGRLAAANGLFLLVGRYPVEPAVGEAGAGDLRALLLVRRGVSLHGRLGPLCHPQVLQHVSSEMWCHFHGGKQGLTPEALVPALVRSAGPRALVGHRFSDTGGRGEGSRVCVGVLSPRVLLSEGPRPS